MMATNVQGASNVLGAAARLGLDPIVHVSSVAALLDPRATVLRIDSAVADSAAGAYGRSKASVETYARSLQADGTPIVITYPGMVLGPPAGTAFGESAVGVEKLLQYGLHADEHRHVADHRRARSRSGARRVSRAGPRATAVSRRRPVHAVATRDGRASPN